MPEPMRYIDYNDLAEAVQNNNLKPPTSESLVTPASGTPYVASQLYIPSKILGPPRPYVRELGMLAPANSKYYGTTGTLAGFTPFEVLLIEFRLILFPFERMSGTNYAKTDALKAAISSYTSFASALPSTETLPQPSVVISLDDLGGTPMAVQ